jgi:hypothetical protein
LLPLQIYEHLAAELSFHLWINFPTPQLPTICLHMKFFLVVGYGVHFLNGFPMYMMKETLRQSVFGDPILLYGICMHNIIYSFGEVLNDFLFPYPYRPRFMSNKVVSQFPFSFMNVIFGNVSASVFNLLCLSNVLMPLLVPCHPLT